MQEIVCVESGVFDFMSLIRCFTLAGYVQEGLTPQICQLFSDLFACVTGISYLLFVAELKAG